VFSSGSSVFVELVNVLRTVTLVWFYSNLTSDLSSPCVHSQALCLPRRFSLRFRTRRKKVGGDTTTPRVRSDCYPPRPFPTFFLGRVSDLESISFGLMHVALLHVPEFSQLFLAGKKKNGAWSHAARPRKRDAPRKHLATPSPPVSCSAARSNSLIQNFAPSVALCPTFPTEQETNTNLTNTRTDENRGEFLFARAIGGRVADSVGQKGFLKVWKGVKGRRGWDIPVEHPYGLRFGNLIPTSKTRISLQSRGAERKLRGALCVVNFYPRLFF